MRILEWFLCGVSVLGIVWLLLLQPSYSTLWFGVAAGIVLLLHAWLEGMHWQMVPAYLALPLTLLIGVTANPLIRIPCAIIAAAMVGASIVVSWALPMFKLPVPSGKFPVGTRMLYLTDFKRAETHEWARPGNREVVAQLWYPAATAKWRRAVYRRKKETTLRSSYQAVLKTHSLQDAPMATGPFPVVVFNPAWWGFRNRSTFLTQDLASHGFVVVALSHPYNSSLVELADGTVANPNYSQDLGFSMAEYIPIQGRFAMAEEELAIQTADCRFVLDELEKLVRTPGHPLESRLYTDRVGAFGYSFGGGVSAEFAREDHRVLAALELDGVLHGAAAVHGLDKPVLLMDAPWMLSPGQFTENWAPKSADNTLVAETSQFWNTIAASKARLLEKCGGILVVIEGLGHFDFMDQIFMSPLHRFSLAGSVPPKRLAHIVTTYIAAFFQQTLLDKPSPLFSDGAKDFAEVTVQEWRPCMK
jgi:dienelactone hydrolase